MKLSLSYDKLRRIIALVHDNPVLKAKLDEFLSGNATSFSETDLLGLITSSEVDKDLIRILSGSDPDQMDALDGLEVISGFFAYIATNKVRFASWLASIGFQVAKADQKIVSKNLK